MEENVKRFFFVFKLKSLNFFLYSVTQSYANSFLEYVVVDTFINVSKDVDNIFDQIYIEQICPDFYYDDFDFHNIIRKCILTLNYH